MSTEHELVKSVVKKFIEKNMFFNNVSLSFNDKTSFLESGLLDSTGVLELINFIQKEYKIKMHEHEMIPENLDSIEKIADFVSKKNSAS